MYHNQVVNECQYHEGTDRGSWGILRTSERAGVARCRITRHRRGRLGMLFSCSVGYRATSPITHFRRSFSTPNGIRLLESERALMKSRQRRSPSVEEKPRPHGASLGRRPRRCRSIVISPGPTHRRRDALPDQVLVNTGFIHAPSRLPRGPRVQRGRRRRSLDCCLAGRRRQRIAARRRRGPYRRVQLLGIPPSLPRFLAVRLGDDEGLAVVAFMCLIREHWMPPLELPPDRSTVFRSAL
jgi:hypothetical protein